MNRSYHQYSIIKIIIYITRQGVLIAILVKVCVFVVVVVVVVVVAFFLLCGL